MEVFKFNSFLNFECGIIISNSLNFDEKTGLEKYGTNYILGSKEKNLLKMRIMYGEINSNWSYR